MKCERAELLIDEMLTGEIGTGDRAGLEEHLLECGACRVEFEKARAAWEVEWPEVPVPARLAGSLPALMEAPSWMLWIPKAATAAAALLCAILLVMNWGRRPAVAGKPATCSPQPHRVAAMMQTTGLGSLVAKDEEGRPVGELGLRSHVVEVEILDGIAKTTVEENFENHTDRRLEGTFHFPLPADASISRLALEVNGKMEEGTCLERERAREVFETIVRRMQDPALLEWMPGGIFKCRVFPIEPRSTKRVIVAYTQALPFFRGRLSYVYPLASEKTREHPPGEVRIEVRARFSGRLKRIESPSHPMDIQRRDGHEARMVFSSRNYRPVEDFVLRMETEDEEVRLIPHKMDGEDGYFALFLTPRGEPQRQARKYVFVMDISASVSGPELDVAKRLVQAMMGRAIAGDRFEILAHNIEIERSGEVDSRAAGDFLDRLKPVGGSDVLKALLEAPEGEIVYIGEGTPTMGETDPAKILEGVKGRRIRTIGIGSDANVQLLERLGAHFRVNPNDHVAGRVEEIASTMGCEALRDVRIGGGEAVYDVAGLRDVFYGERLAVAGRYRGSMAKLVVKAGDYRREVAVTLPPKESGNSYVRRLWAQMKAAELLARGGSKDEVTALGVKYQIMTPYTSFLVLESEEMWKEYKLKRQVPRRDEVGKPETGVDPSREKHRLAVAYYNKGDFERARIECQKAVQEWPENLEARKLLAEINMLVVVGRAGSGARSIGEDEVNKWRTRIEQAQKRIPESVLKGGGGAEAADEHYRQAERYLQAGDFEKAEHASGEALRLDPGHAGANALFLENQFILGRGKATPPSEDMALYRQHALVRHQQVLLEVDQAQARGMRAYERGDLAGADREFRTILEYAKWMPAGAELETRRKDALDMLNRGDRRGTLEEWKRAFEREADLETIGRRNDLSVNLREEIARRKPKGIAELEEDGTTSSLQYERQRADRLQQDLAELENKHVEIAREKKLLEERINHLNQMGVKTEAAPKRALEGKVTAVAPEIGLVVISVGRDAGVGEGDEFTICRGGDFVVKVAIDRVDRKWAAGKIVLKKVDPRIGDDVSNQIVVRAFPQADREIEVKSAGEGTEEVVLGAGAEAGIARGQLFAVARGGKFVALVQVTETSGKQARIGVWQGLAVDRVMAGDRARRVADAGSCLAVLPQEVRLDLESRANLQGIRAKMGWKE